jgi:hypothetical protein
MKCIIRNGVSYLEKITKHIESLENIKNLFTEEDVIEGVPEKSVEEIIREVAVEEGMTEEEVAKAVEAMANMSFNVAKKKRHTKAKLDKAKSKVKKKQAKKSKKRNR